MEVRGAALALAAAIVLVTDVAVLADASGITRRPFGVDELGHVVERARAPATAARKVVLPRRPPVGERPPETFWSGGGSPPPAAQGQAHLPDWVAARGQEALRAISYPWRQLGFTVEFRAARSGLRAVTYTHERRIVVHVRRSDPVEQTAFDLAHEIGHAFDLVLGTWPLRERWLELRGIDASTPWFGCAGCDDLATGSGDLAEVFALWQVGPVDFASRLAPPPDPGQLADLTTLFDPGWASHDDPTRRDGAGGAASPDDDGTTGHGGDARPRDDASDGDGEVDGDGYPEGDEDDGGRGDDADGDDGDEEDEGDDDGVLPCPIICG